MDFNLDVQRAVYLTMVSAICTFDLVSTTQTTKPCNFILLNRLTWTIEIPNVLGMVSSLHFGDVQVDEP